MEEQYTKEELEEKPKDEELIILGKEEFKQLLNEVVQRTKEQVRKEQRQVTSKAVLDEMINNVFNLRA